MHREDTLIKVTQLLRNKSHIVMLGFEGDSQATRLLHRRAILSPAGVLLHGTG